MEKKNNNVLICILLLIIGLLIGATGTYLYFDNSNNAKEVTKESKKENVNKEDETLDDVKVPTDMNKVSEKLNEYLGLFIKRIASDDSKLNTNLVADSSNRLHIVNSLLISTNAGTNYNDNQATCVNINDYKTKYKEYYGSLDGFDNDTKNVTGGIYFTGDSFGSSSDLACWNSLWNSAGYSVNIQASNVTYDKDNKLFTITGVVNYTVTGSSDYTHNFSLIYANNGSSNYITSLVLS